MFRKWNRVLAFLLSIVLITTTFGSDFTSTFVYAAEDAQDLQNLAAENGDLPEIFEEGQTISDLDEEKKDTETQKEIQEVSQEVGDETNSEEEVEKDPETVVTDLEEEASSEGEDEEPAEAVPDKEFKESVEMDDGMKISLYAVEGVLPGDAELKVTKISESKEEKIQELIDGEMGESVNVVETFSYDIKIVSPSAVTEDNEEGEVQPEDENTVEVRFEQISEVSDEVEKADTGIAVYHVNDTVTEVEEQVTLPTSADTEEVSFDAEHFSIYAVTIYKQYKTYSRFFNISALDYSNGSRLGNSNKFDLQKDYEVRIKPAELAKSINSYVFVKATVTPYSSDSDIKYFRLHHIGDKYYDYAQYTLSDNPAEEDWHYLDTDSYVYFWYSKSVSVAVYATDGTPSTTVNPILQEKFGLNYVQTNHGGGTGYYPVAIIELPQSVFSNPKKSGQQYAYINNQQDMDRLKAALQNATVKFDKLKTEARGNANNTVLSSGINAIQFEYKDAGADAAHHLTTLMSWPKDWNEDGFTGKYAYHLDLRFATNVVTFIGEYEENGRVVSGPSQIDQKAYLKGETTSLSYGDALAIANNHATIDGKTYPTVELYSDSNYSNKITEGSSIALESDKTIYVKYVNTTSHTVSFSKGDQENVTSMPSSQTITNGFTATEPEEIPVVADNTYVFDGWYLENSETPYNFNTPVTTDITLVAHWKENTTTYTVNHYKQKLGGDASKHDTENYELVESDSTKTAVVGDSVTPVVKTYTGFTAPVAQPVTVEVNTDGTPKTVVNYYYTRNTYTITYDANGGSGSMEPQTVPYEGTVNISNNGFTREHYRFDGWKDANGNSYAVNAVYPGEGTAYADLELFAQWKALTKVTISPKNVQNQYNGQPLTADFTSDLDTTKYELRNTDSITYSVSSITDAEIKTYSVDGVQNVKVFDKAGNDVTRDFELVASTATATMTVTPITIKVGTGTARQKFNGRVLKCTDIFIDGSETAEPIDNKDNKGVVLYKPLGEDSTETIKLHTTSWRIFPGDEANKYAKEFVGGAKEQNYNVITNPDEGKGLGRLYVLTDSDDAKFIIQADDMSFDYDGTPHSYNKATVVNNPAAAEGYKVDIKNVQTTGSVTYADKPGVNTVVRSSVRILDNDGNDVTSQFREQDIKLTTGDLTINKKAATVTALGAHKTYDGSNIDTDFVKSYNEPDKEYTITELANGDYEEVKTSFVGDVKNVEGNQSKAENHRVTEVKIYHKNQDGSKTDVTDSYDITKVAGVVYVDPKEFHIETQGAEKEYDGVALTNEKASVEGLVDGETAKIKAVGSQLEVGNSDNDYEKNEDGTPAITWGTLLSPVKASNYIYKSDADEIGLLNVKANESAQVTISVPSFAKIYDGETYTVTSDKATLKVTQKDDKGNEVTLDNFALAEVTLVKVDSNDAAADSVSVKNAGTVTYKVAGYKIVDKNNSETADAKEWFANKELKAGTLTVFKKTVVFTSKGYPEVLTKEFDGDPLTSANVEVSIPTNYDNNGNVVTEGKPALTTSANYPEGEGFEVSATGTVTYPDVNATTNTIVYSATEGTLEANYNIVKHEGTLQVTPVADENKAQFTLQVGSAEGTYNGTAYSVNGFVHTEKNASGDTDGTKFQWKGHTYTVTGLTVAGSATNAKVKDQKQDELWVADSYSVSASGKAVILDENNKDVTSQFAVPEILPGTITINPKTVELTSASWERVYNGKAFTNADGLADAIKKAKAEGRKDDALNLQNTEGVTGLDGFITREDGTKEGVKLSFDGSITVPGDTANTFSVASYENGTLETNYNIVTTPGKLSVISSNAHYVVKVVANSDTVVYDGKPHSVSGFEKVIVVDVDNNNKETEYEVKDGKLAFKLNGADFTIEGLEAKMAKESYTDVLKDDDDILSRPVVVQRGEVVVKQGNDPVTGEFTVQTVDGSLTINPRKITLKSVSYEKLYDGVALSTQWLVVNKKIKESEKVAISFPEGQDGAFVGTDGIVSYNFTGSQLLPGGSEGNNTFTYALVEGTKSQNYDIKKEFGTLTVKSRKGVDPFILNVKAASKEATYTGQPIEASGFDESDYDNMEVVKLEDGTTALQFTAESGAVFYITGLEASRSETDVLVAKDKRGNNKKDREGNWVVDSYSVPVTGTAVVVDAAGNTVTDEFAFGKVKAGKLKINPIKIKFTSGSAEKEYDGDPLTNDEVKVDGAFAQGEKAVFTVTGTETLPTKKNVSHNNKFTYELVNAKETNYDVKTEFGTLKVTNRSGANKWKIELKGNSATYYYNGDSQKISGFEKMSFEFNGHTYYVSGVTSSAKGKDVLYKDGKVVAKDTKIEGKPKVNDEAGHDVTKSFKVTVKEGTLLINPRPVTLTSANGEKKYDGTELTTYDLVKEGKLKKEITVGGMGFVKNHGKQIQYTVTGSQTIVGSSANEFTYKFKRAIKDIGKNYAITKIYGTLTVFDRGEDERFEVTVVANSDEFLYDGTEHSVSGFKEVRVKVGENKYDTYEVKGGVLEFKLNGETFKIADVSTIAGKATDVVLNESTDENGVKSYVEAPAAAVNVSDTSLAVVYDSKHNPVTAQFAVYAESGDLTIHRRKVTLVAGSASKDFDGKALTCPEYSIKTGEGIDGFAVYTKDGKEVNEKNGITVTTSGSVLRHEDSPAENEIAKVDFDGVIAKASNYIVTTEKGKLTINSLGKKIVLDIILELDQDGGNNKEVTYNGKQQSMDVTIGITPKMITETEETQTTTEGGNTETPSPITQNSDDNDEGDTSDLSAMIGKLMSLGSITVYAAEGEDIFEDVEQLKYNSTATFTYGDTTFVVSGITLEGGAGKDVGEYPVTINLKNLSVTVGKTVDGKVVADEKAPVDEFAFNVIKPETSTEGNNVVGVLNIVEKEITVSTGSASKDYDGNPLTSNVASIDGIVNGETYKITATGSRTEVGTSKNTYKIDWWAPEDNKYTAKETNYKIVGENLGDLRVDRVSSGGGGGDDTPVFFTLAAPAPAGAVLGAQRVVGDGPAVLGARRSSTDDNTNSMARVFAMVAAAAIAVTMMITGKKKDEEEEG